MYITLSYLFIYSRMAEGLFALELINLHNRIRHFERRVERRWMRETQDPFDLCNVQFIDLYRLSPELILNLIQTLEPQLQRSRLSGLSVDKQVHHTLLIKLLIIVIYI